MSERFVEDFSHGSDAVAGFDFRADRGFPLWPVIGLFAVCSEVSGNDLGRAREVLKTRCSNLRKSKGGMGRLSLPGDSSQIVLVISEKRDGLLPGFLGGVMGAEEEVEIVALGENSFDQRGEQRQGPSPDKKMRFHSEGQARF